MTPHPNQAAIERAVRVFSWCLLAVAAGAALYTVFAHWAVNAESFGKRDAGWALFFAVSGAWMLVACFWLIPVAVTTAMVVKLTRSGPARLFLIAAALGALPFLILR